MAPILSKTIFEHRAFSWPSRHGYTAAPGIHSAQNVTNQYKRSHRKEKTGRLLKMDAANRLKSCCRISGYERYFSSFYLLL